jgi:hypothetical protein
MIHPAWHTVVSGPWGAVLIGQVKGSCGLHHLFVGRTKLTRLQSFPTDERFPPESALAGNTEECAGLGAWGWHGSPGIATTALISSFARTLCQAGLCSVASDNSRVLYGREMRSVLDRAMAGLGLVSK